jgi:hypothetical protein
VQADRVGRDRQVALVDDGLALDQGKAAERRHRLVEAPVSKHRAERFT